LQQLIAQNKFDDHLPRTKIMTHLDSWVNSSLLELIVYPYGIERLHGDGLYLTFVAEFTRVANKLGLSESYKINQDRGEAPHTTPDSNGNEKSGQQQ